MVRLLFCLQLGAFLLVLWRLLPGFRRLPPVAPRQAGVDADLDAAAVSVIIPALNEARRIRPCLEGMLRQGNPLREVIVVESRSTDDTAAVVREFADRDARIRLAHDPPLPEGWIGKVWALQHGLSLARSEWILGMDADTEASEGMVAGAVSAARASGLDLVSFSPTFAAQRGAERFVQPSMLLTLVYRTGAPGTKTPPTRVLANGQCFLVRRDVLLAHGGYAPARHSFADDVTLARHYAVRGVRVGFLDGSRLYRVRAYESLGEMWREWGRSIDLRDATTPLRLAGHAATLVLMQALPLLVLLLAWAGGLPDDGWREALVWLNGGLVAWAALMRVAVAGAYERRGIPYWLSPLTDPLAVSRVVASMLRRPNQWRGRTYRPHTATGERTGTSVH